MIQTEEVRNNGNAITNRYRALVDVSSLNLLSTTLDIVPLQLCSSIPGDIRSLPLIGQSLKNQQSQACGPTVLLPRIAAWSGKRSLIWKSPERCPSERNRTSGPVRNKNRYGITQSVIAKNRNASKLIYCD